MKKKTSISLSDDVHAKVRAAAKRERRSVSSFLELFIEDSIDRVRAEIAKPRQKTFSR